MSVNELFARSYALYGEENMQKFHKTTAIVFGLGGVGGHCAESLVRIGFRKLYLVDKDVVAASNINRQILAAHKHIGEDKTALARARFADINPYIELVEMKRFYLPENPVDIPEDVDIIFDCIDTIAAKIHLIETAAKLRKPIISCMGMGNRFDPSHIQVAALEKTRNDPLSKVMRKLAKERGIRNVTVVCSDELPHKCNLSDNPNKAVPGSLPFVPSVAGITMAAHACNAIVQDIHALIPSQYAPESPDEYI